MTVDKITAPRVKALVDSHLQRHCDYYDLLLRETHDAVFGPQNNDGLVADVREIVKGYATMKGIGLAILIALLVNILIKFI